MKTFKTPLTIRGDSLYCPLAFGLDTYYDCPYQCSYCYCRALNHTWGKGEQRVADPDAVLEQLERGLVNKNPRGSLANAIARKKTIRFGNKSDPFPPEEQHEQATQKILEGLKRLNWSTKLETKTTDFMLDGYLRHLHPSKDVITVTVTCGLDRDYKAFEPSSLPTPEQRLVALQNAAQLGFQVGVIAEPFLPGWHTVEDWKTFLTALRDHGIGRANVYHAHLNAFVLKRLNDIDGVDVEKVWEENQDDRWKPILLEIIELSKQAGIILGCPDFVNSGGYREPCNTCCGVDVVNPTSFNFITWKNTALDNGSVDWAAAERSWDGIGDRELGQKVFNGEATDFYGWKELGWKQDGSRWTPADRPATKGRFF